MYVGCQTLLEIFRKSLNRRLNRPRRGVAQRTKRFAFNVVAEIQEQLNVVFVSAAAFNAFENLYQPVGPFATGRAPTARFMLVEFSQVHRRFKYIYSLIHHDESA